MLDGSNGGSTGADVAIRATWASRYCFHGLELVPGLKASDSMLPDTTSKTSELRWNSESFPAGLLF
eukprot:NODE_391_length_3094_cov_6.381867.p11 GENE.NODE_391_length_3094_cov_6.381867~~NODE_391_length_3094_cov_6.381867.p11  ORF type:complete len:66 (-),score=0.97 NODE_391_length_3094_cov_6.381867:362-559(-)